jgi:hypothetical protein
MNHVSHTVQLNLLCEAQYYNFCSRKFGTPEIRGFSLWKPIKGGKCAKSVLGNSE